MEQTGKRWALLLGTCLLVLSVFLVLVAVLPAGAAPAGTVVTGSITAEKVWTAAGSPYVLEGYVTVEAGVTLTVEPGVVVKGMAGSALDVHGRLQAVGTAIETIIFTSLEDSGPGEWGGLYLAGSAQLEQVTVRYADYPVSVDAPGGGVIVKNSAIVDNTGAPLVVNVRVLHQLQMDNVTFSGNTSERGIILVEPPDPDGTMLHGDVMLTAQPGLEGYEVQTLSGMYGPPRLEIPSGVTLTLAPGVRLMTPDMVHVGVGGHLEAVGTPNQPVVFTSPSDFARGEWFGVDIAGSAHLAYAHVRRAYINLAVDRAAGGPVLLENSVLSDSADLPLVVSVKALPRLQMEDVTFSNNALEHAVILVDAQSPTFDGFELPADATLTAQPGLDGYEVQDLSDPEIGILEVPDGVTLTLAPGVRLMTPDMVSVRAGGRLHAVGTAAQPVVFTSPSDFGPGEWSGIDIGGSGYLDHAHIRNGVVGVSSSGRLRMIDSSVGDNDLHGVYVGGGTAELACTTVSGNLAHGIYVSGTTTQTATVYGATLKENLGAGVRNDTTVPIDARYSWWGDSSGPGGDGPGSGAEVFGNVLYAPWLPAPGCAPATPTLSITRAGMDAAHLAWPTHASHRQYRLWQAPTPYFTAGIASTALLTKTAPFDFATLLTYTDDVAPVAFYKVTAANEEGEAVSAEVARFTFDLSVPATAAPEQRR